jgi:hypothetical protein
VRLHEVTPKIENRGSKLAILNPLSSILDDYVITPNAANNEPVNVGYGR